MRKFAAVLMCTLFLALVNCPGSRIKPIDPLVQLDPEKNYTVVYWDAEPPWVLDPQGIYRSGVEQLLEEFRLEYPAISVEIRWLEWSEAEANLSAALRDGNPPDIWADWQSLARRDHVLQVPAGIWLDEENLTPAGKRTVSHQGQVWAWPRWIWPRGLLTLRDSLDLSDQELEVIINSGWEWEEFCGWLAENNLHLDVNDWEMGFSSQTMLAATGYGCGKWGGQELSEVFSALEAWKRQGRITGTGEYMKITRGKNIIGGAEPAFLTWITENMPEEDVVLLPIPGMSMSRYTPVTSVNLLQFRQLKYKGDEHSLAAAIFAQYMARGQGNALAENFWAAPAFDEPAWNPPSLPKWHYYLLMEAVETGVPLYAIDLHGREWERNFRALAGKAMADFWANKADAQDIALRMEELE